MKRNKFGRHVPKSTDKKNEDYMIIASMVRTLMLIAVIIVILLLLYMNWPEAFTGSSALFMGIIKKLNSDEDLFTITTRKMKAPKWWRATHYMSNKRKGRTERVFLRMAAIAIIILGLLSLYGLFGPLFIP